MEISPKQNNLRIDIASKDKPEIYVLGSTQSGKTFIIAEAITEFLRYATEYLHQAGAYISSVIGSEIGALVSGKTKIDIILTPLTTIIPGGLVGVFVGPYINQFMQWLGSVINNATELAPIPMGIVVSVVVGLALTAPISSAALCIMIGIDGIAAGAACVGFIKENNK